MSRKNKAGAPVVITRKDKRLFKTGHLLAFMVTGGTSAVYTAAKAATNAGYNARTRELQAQSERSDSFSTSDHDRARRAGEELMRRMREGQ